MEREINKESSHGIIAAVMVTVILICVVLLIMFLCLHPASNRQVAQGKAYEKAIGQLPSESELKRSVRTQTKRVETLFSDLYVRCVRGVEQLGAKLSQWSQTYDQLNRQTTNNL